MTDEKRLAKLEKQAEDMRIVSSGPGTALGLPVFERKGSTVEERLANLEKWTKDFQLVGKDLDVAGSFEDGFVING
jgi:hypothetical protein